MKQIIDPSSPEVIEIMNRVRDKFFFDVDNVMHLYIPPNGILYVDGGFEGGPASGMKVLGLASDVTACGHYRVKYPLMVLASQGAACCARIVNKEHPITMNEFFAANVLYLQRAADPALLKMVKDVSKVTGALIIYDMDDYLHGVAESSPAYPVYNPNTVEGRAVLAGIDSFLGAADGVIFSTRELQQLYKNKVKRSVVLLNGLDSSLGDRSWSDDTPRYDWKSLAKRTGCNVNEDSVSFGWSGGACHSDDLLLLGDSVKEILNRVPNSFFLIQSHPDLCANFCVNKWKLPLDRVVYIPTTQFKDYPQPLSAFDLCLAPLSNTKFNLSKSCLRLLELSAWGAPYIASSVAPFQRFHKETKGQGGLLAKDSFDFARQAIGLLNNRELLTSKGQWAKNYVRSAYDIRNTMGSLAYTIKSFQLQKQGIIEPRSFLQISDSINKIPEYNKIPSPKDFCPCGSGYIYKKCCIPAFGGNIR